MTQKPRVLILEDDLALRRATERLLSAYDVTTAGTVAEARALLLAETFDVVVSDVELPDGNGVTLFEEVAWLRPACARGYVFVTGTGDFVTQRAKMEHLGVPWLTKPIEVRVLLDHVATIVASKGLAGASGDA